MRILLLGFELWEMVGKVCLTGLTFQDPKGRGTGLGAAGRSSGELGLVRVGNASTRSALLSLTVYLIWYRVSSKD